MREPNVESLMARAPSPENTVADASMDIHRLSHLFHVDMWIGEKRDE
jgi:hypothetical protein